MDAVEEVSPEKTAAQAFLQSLLNKNLRIQTTDGRMFRGEFKCTDPVSVHLGNSPPSPSFLGFPPGKTGTLVVQRRSHAPGTHESSA